MVHVEFDYKLPEIDKAIFIRKGANDMRYFVGLSCEEYCHYENISFCHNDLFLLQETLINFCDYERENTFFQMVYVDADESSCTYWYNELEKVCKKSTQYDTILFYFAGHGTVLGDDAFLLLPNAVPGDEIGTALSLSRINMILKTAKGSSFKIIDACHSGFDVRGDVNAGFVSKLIDKSWATLASCSEKECSYPDSKKEQGIFTYYISEAIKKWKKENEITIEELKVVVAGMMADWCKDTGLSQHPTLNASIVGIQSLAIRNNKIAEYEVIVVDEQEEKAEVKEEIQIVHTELPALWTAANGIQLPKRADVADVLALNVQLREKEIKGIYGLYVGDNFEFASETIWERSILILRERVLSLGLEFVGEMVGLDNLEYVKELPAFEVINLAAELGFINNTGKMHLSQANELVQHYKGRDVDDDMPQNESDTVIRACIQYILGYDSSEITIEYGDFRSSLKYELFEKNSAKMEMLANSPYFYKKTTIRTLINLLSSTEGAEYETVSANFCAIVECVWESLSSDDRYFIGITYSKYANQGNQTYILTFKRALERVHGFDYVPENLRSLSFIQAAKHVKSVHYAFNNFYNEPEAVSKLERLGNQIPRPAIRECVSACLMVILGNAYGRSFSAIDPVYQVLDKLDRNAWSYYINDCLPFDEEVLSKIKEGDERTTHWCEVIIKYNLCEIDIRDGKMKEMLQFSSKNDRNNTKAIASMYLKKLVHN